MTSRFSFFTVGLFFSLRLTKWPLAVWPLRKKNYRAFFSAQKSVGKNDNVSHDGAGPSSIDVVLKIFLSFKFSGVAASSSFAFGMKPGRGAAEFEADLK